VADVLLSTDFVEPSLRDEVWREITKPYFETTQRAEDGDTALEGSVLSRSVGTLLTGPTTFNRQHYNRDRRIVLQSGLDHYLLQLFVSGSLQGDCDGRAISVEPGDICAFDLARTFTSSVHAGSTISAAADGFHRQPVGRVGRLGACRRFGSGGRGHRPFGQRAGAPASRRRPRRPGTGACAAPPRARFHRRELVRPDASSRSISEIAYRLGFSGSAQFLRAFRFGMTPSEARHEGAQPVLADRRLAQVQARFVEYVQQLSAMDRSST
jgi:AraC-like DNA-binding protein